MHITFSDGRRFITWRHKAGQVVDGAWVTSDSDGERTGPYGRQHATRDGEAAAACGKVIPLDALPVTSHGAPVADICRACLQVIMRPY